MKKFLLSAVALLFSIHTINASDNVESIHNHIKQVEGTLLYKERMFLPPNSSITITLEDLSHANTIIASKTFNATKSPPFHFTLSYDANKIEKTSHYALRAKITHDNQLLFSTIEDIDPFHKPLKVLLRRMGNKKADLPIQNKYWKLLRIEDVTIIPSEKLKDPNFILEKENKVVGFSGCNRFSGMYQIEGDAINFSQIDMMQMTCQETMPTEQAFQNVLQKTTHYKIQGEKLQLFSNTQVLASFRVVYFDKSVEE